MIDLKRKTIAVTGAAGFIGQNICREFRGQGLRVRAIVRRQLPNMGDQIEIGEIGESTNWDSALRDVDCVIHCAARAHVHKETSADPSGSFRSVNVDATARLAEQAARLGVRRLIFLSSIGVLGVNTNGRLPFSIRDIPAPQDAYSKSKLEAEEALGAISRFTNMEIVIVRLPLVYGFGAPGNFARLQRLIKIGFPLPFGAVKSRRSMLAIENLIDLLRLLLAHPRAGGQIFLASDPGPISLPDLVKLMRECINRPPRLFSIDTRFLRLAAGMLGKRLDLERLIGSLEIDCSHTFEVLGWVPPLTVEDGLRRSFSDAATQSHSA